MAPLDFEILSKLMRYVFTFLGAVIVWRSFAWLRKDRKATHKRLKALPDAGTIGYLTVLEGSSELPEGRTISVPPEGVLGFVRTCDIVVPVTDVVGQHLDFTFHNGKGLYIYPRRGCPVLVDGVPVDSRAATRRHPLRHGSLLQVGEALLQLSVFAGLDVQQVDGVRTDAPTDGCPPEAVSPLAPAPFAPPPADIPPAAQIPRPVWPAPDAAPQYYQYPPAPLPHQAPPPTQAYYQPPFPMTPPERRPDDDA